MMKALVTGATGLLGNNLVRMLLDSGAEVRAMSTSAVGSHTLRDLDVEPFEADIRDADAVAQATEDVDVVLNCAGLVCLGWSQAAEHDAVNFGGARNIADALRGRDVRLVHVSSVNALGVAWPDRVGTEDDHDSRIPLCPYVTSKRAGDEYIARCVESGDLDAVIVYPGFFMGPWDWKPSSGQLLLGIAKRYSPWVPIGGASLADARDIASGAVAAYKAGRTGRRYILAGHNLRHREIWRVVAECIGTHRPILPLGPLAVALGGWGSAVIERVTGREPLVNSAALKIASRRTWFSSQRAMDELGYEFRPVEQIVQEAWQWLVECHDQCKSLAPRRTQLKRSA